MGLSQTEIDPVTGGTIYYIDNGISGKIVTINNNGATAQSQLNKRIAKAVRSVGGRSRWTNVYSKGGTTYAQIWGDQDVVDISNFDMSKDSIVFTDIGSYNNSKAYPALNNSGTFIASGQNILVTLLGVSLEAFAAQGQNVIGHL